MKPPAFQFYSDDFVSGVSDLTQDEVGAYILLLCYQWNRGEIPTDPQRVAMIAKGDVSKHVMSKFPNGKNPRMEKVRAERDAWVEKQRENANKRWHKDANATALPALMPSQCSPSPSPSPNIRATHTLAHFPEVPCWESVKAHAEKIGLVEWKSRVWFDEMEGAGWKDRHGRQVSKWQNLLNTVKTYWEADGRPMQPKSQTQTNHANSRPNRPDRNAGTFHVGKSTDDIKSKVR